MNAVARSLALLAVAAHLGMAMVDAYAKGGGAAGGGAAGGGTGGGGTGGAGRGSVVTSPGGTDGGADERKSPASTSPRGGALAACGRQLALPDPRRYASALEGLAAISEQTERYIKRCGCDTQACIADALDRYADALELATPALPPAARSLPHIVHVAAQRARAAPTVRAAAKALRAAVAVVHKTISLLRAADPDANNVATRGGDLVAHTLDTAATALERADTL